MIEWAVINPSNGIVMTVPDGSHANAVKMAQLVNGSGIVSRYVGPWKMGRPCDRCGHRWRECTECPPGEEVSIIPTWKNDQ